jgi:FlgN protein
VSTALLAPAGLGADVLRHIDDQIQSARRLLDSVLAQGAAIRRQDVETVVARLGDVQVEMEHRAVLERDRTRLLARAGTALGRPAHDIELSALVTLMSPDEGAQANHRSAELRGLLAEIAREHLVNRALMRQELTFLDHLTRLMGGGDQAPLGYSRPAAGAGAGGLASPAPVRAAHHVLNVQA